tara:strand:+ start:629 stop:1348 length:720 start_codon:yes stop_codon:yes gene_type:complete
MNKNKITALVGAVALFLGALATPLMAGSLGVGVVGSAALIEADGTETLKTTSVETKGDASALGGLASGYAQYRFGDNGLVFGINWSPGKAQIGDVTASRNDAGTTYCAGTVPRASCDAKVENRAKASVENFVSGYVETPGFTPLGLYLLYSYNELEVKTEEKLGTGASYPDETINGHGWGIGIKGTADTGLSFKLAYEVIDWDTINLTSTAAASPDTATNTIKANVDTEMVRMSIGYNF